MGNSDADISLFLVAQPPGTQLSLGCLPCPYMTCSVRKTTPMPVLTQPIGATATATQDFIDCPIINPFSYCRVSLVSSFTKRVGIQLWGRLARWGRTRRPQKNLHRLRKLKLHWYGCGRLWVDRVDRVETQSVKNPWPVPDIIRGTG